jgi:hypothetical protein
MQVNSYASSVSSALAKKYPFLSKVIAGTSVTGTGPFTRTTVLTSMGGEKFTHFAKHKKWTSGMHCVSITC